MLGLILLFSLTWLGCDNAEDAANPLGGEDNANEADDNVFACPVVSDWPESRAVLEQEVIAEVNIRRAAGADCRTGGSFDPTHDLAHNDKLQCAARGHSLDMVERDFFDHVSPDGGQMTDRASAVGYDYYVLGENIAMGHTNAKEVVDGWMTSDGHCANIMSPEFLELGVGYHDGEGKPPVWTQVFGSSF